MLGKLPVPGRPTILITVGQGPTVFGIFTLIYPFSSLSPSLWETARYRLKYCLKGPLNPKQPTKLPLSGGGRVVRWSRVTSSAGVSYNLDDTTARAYCASSRCGWGLFEYFYSHLSLLSPFSLFLGDGPI